MNTTGIVRRIDDLGRVVIPKEIRRTLRIRDGEALEIEVRDDNIVLKRYSSFGDIQSFLNILISNVNKLLNKNILIFDTDKVIGVSGMYGNNYIGNNISDYMYELLNSRKVGCIEWNDNLEIVKGEFVACNYLFSSIVPNGDVIGGIVIFDSDNDINDNDKMFLNLIIETLTKYIEE